MQTWMRRRSRLERHEPTDVAFIVLQLAGTIQPALQPALNSSASMTASLFVSTIVKSITDCTALSLEMASPCGDTMVQAALHCASSKGFPFFGSLRASYSANQNGRAC